MRLLADTRVLLWAVASPEKLGARARQALSAADNDVWLSTVSLWEIGIKVSVGRLDLDPDWPEVIEEGRKQLRARWLTLQPRHCRGIADLPWHHRDPFDRMLVAQAMSDGMTLLSRDRILRRYGVDVLW